MFLFIYLVFVYILSLIFVKIGGLCKIKEWAFFS